MGGHYQILIVEDSPEDREFYRRALESDPNNHYRVFEVNNGDEALALVPELAIDLVLLDFELPDMTGLELFAQLCDDIACVVPTIMLTGQGNEAVAVRAMKLGVEDYLVKGKYSPEELRNSVEAVVRKPSLDGTLAVGTLFAGRYEIVRLAGSGGMSSVYRALDRTTTKHVALKVIRNPDRRSAARFRREASVLAALSSPSIVQYLAHGMTPDGDRFLAMEWLEGEDLASQLSRGPLSIADTLTVARRIADALNTAHALGLIHRDIKPSNLFLPGAKISQAKLLDFGIVLSSAEATSRFTRTGTTLGTPGYMAPEQALGLQNIDHRADMYGLGSLLYHCLTGNPPFSDHLGGLTRSLLDPAPPVDQLRSETPSFLVSLIGYMLEQEPERRPQSMASILEALDRHSTLNIRIDRPCKPKPRAQPRCTLLLAIPDNLAHISFHHVDVLVRQREIVEQYEGKISVLSARDVQVQLPAKSSLTSELEIGVRCAAKIHEAFPRLIIVIASSYGSTSTMPSEPSVLLSRARRQLAFAKNLRIDSSSADLGVILVDDICATLLKGRYALKASGPYFRLGYSLDR